MSGPYAASSAARSSRLGTGAARHPGRGRRRPRPPEPRRRGRTCGSAPQRNAGRTRSSRAATSSGSAMPESVRSSAATRSRPGRASRARPRTAPSALADEGQAHFLAALALGPHDAAHDDGGGHGEPSHHGDHQISGSPTWSEPSANQAHRSAPQATAATAATARQRSPLSAIYPPFIPPFVP